MDLSECGQKGGDVPLAQPMGYRLLVLRSGVHGIPLLARLLDEAIGIRETRGSSGDVHNLFSCRPCVMDLLRVHRCIHLASPYESQSLRPGQLNW